jgi:23S rRNA A1618 N6-methylase RlmF
MLYKSSSIRTFDFAMCNPPFYSSLEEVLRSAEAKDLSPNSICTGSESEMITPGGEARFVGKMVEESLRLKMRCA